MPSSRIKPAGRIVIFLLNADNSYISLADYTIGNHIICTKEANGLVVAGSNKLIQNSSDVSDVDFLFDGTINRVFIGTLASNAEVKHIRVDAFMPKCTGKSLVKKLDTGIIATAPIGSHGYTAGDAVIVNSTNKVTFNGTKWIESDGATAGVARSGTFANKPAAADIYVGYNYFCTDKQTSEGATNGIEIFHKGGGVWVDALGRTVS